MKNKSFETIGIYSGILGPIIMALGMLVTALAYVGIEGQRYNLANHFVSELGEVGISRLAGVFNTSLFLGGLLAMIFMFTLASQFQSWLRYPLLLLGIAATLNGALVGVYPMNDLSNHIFVAMNFFNLGMLVSLLYSLVILFTKKHPFSKWLAVTGLVNAGLFTWFLNFPAEDNSMSEFQEGMQGLIRNRPAFMPMAALEWAVILGIILWAFSLALYLYFQRQSKDQALERFISHDAGHRN